jgi:hypothetical protein
MIVQINRRINKCSAYKLKYKMLYKMWEWKKMLIVIWWHYKSFK